MKLSNLLIGCCCLVSGSSVRAVVIDNFGCDVSVYDHAGQVIASASECPDVARKDTGNAPNGARITLGMYELSLQVPGRQMNLIYRLHYQHAFITRSDGTTAAAQYLCSTAELSLGHGTVVPICANPSSDPFSPSGGWQPVKVVDGIPMFDATPLHSTEVEIADPTGGVGRAVVNCQYTYTLR